MRYLSRGKRGSITALVAVSMTAVLALLAIALEGGLNLEKKRSLQAAVDAAAMAAAADLWDHYPSNGGLDPAGTARASALSTASANGYNNDGTTNIITVNINPLAGDFVGVHGYAEVVIQLNQPRIFSGMWGSGATTIRARAVAGGTPGDVAILMLNPHETVAAQIGDNVNIANNGQIFINSDGTVYGEFGSNHGHNAIYVESTGHLVSGGINSVGPMAIEAGGSVTYTGGGSLRTGLSAWADPYLSILEPSAAGPPAATNYGNKTYSADATMQPGIYGDVTIKANIHVTMAAGTYFVTGGSMVLNNGSTLTGTGVMFYDMPNDYFTKDGIPATASINLSPPSGGPYRGMSVFEPRLNGKEVHIKSIGNITLSGALYSATGEFDLRPLTAGTVLSFGAYIADLAEWSPNGLGTINLDPSTSTPTKRPLLVQ